MSRTKTTPEKTPIGNMPFIWGLLGPETLSGTRRTRTLGLARAVRYFNDRAVPGLGGVWYGKQLMLATLGVVVAERALQLNPRLKANKIQVANAIEALACWSAYKDNRGTSDPRLRGKEKLVGRQANEFVFSSVCKPNFYLTQPMRMSTVQALPALGLVSATGERFNTFVPTQEGLDFVEAACKDYKPFNRNVVSHLMKWVLESPGQDNHVDAIALRKALSPLEPLPEEGEARRLLRARLRQGSDSDTERRRNALGWVEALSKGKSNCAAAEIQKPTEISDEHWFDIQAGALFFRLHDLAIAVLDAVEADMGPKCSLDDGAKKAQDQLGKLKSAAQVFLNHNHNNEDARLFCNKCIAIPTEALRALVQRDDTVLKWEGNEIRRGPAFRGKAIPQSPLNDEPTGDTPVPPGLSYRLRNLYRLNLDLNGDLDAWLIKNKNEGAA